MRGGIDIPIDSMHTNAVGLLSGQKHVGHTVHCYQLRGGSKSCCCVDGDALVVFRARMNVGRI